MTLSDTLKAVDAADDADTALAIAAILNADRLAKKALRQDENFDAASVQRIARIVAAYVDAPRPAADYRPRGQSDAARAMFERASDAGLAAVSQATAAE